MRNLKRTLSLALASVMLVGMMSVGASAVNASDFTDADEIEQGRRFYHDCPGHHQRQGRRQLL